MSSELPLKRQGEALGTVALPSPTAWPIVLAFGITLVFAGMVTTAAVTVLGSILAVTAYIGWFRDVLPLEKHESVPVLAEPPAVTTSRPTVARVQWMTHQQHRARLPLEIYPVSAGVKGGLIGSVVMAILAILYGLIFQHSVWYPINLLAAGFFPEAQNTTAQLAAFQPYYLMLAVIIHLVTSLLVGLLYGAMLPMFPHRPILLAGIVAPILWTGLIHSFLEFVNPVLTSGSTGSGLSSHRWDSALPRELSSRRSNGCAHGSTFHSLFAPAWKRLAPWTRGTERSQGLEEPFHSCIRRHLHHALHRLQPCPRAAGPALGGDPAQ